MRVAEAGINELQKAVDTLIVIPNQNLFRVANEKTTFADAFSMADQVLYSGVACITDLMVKEGLINLDFADVRAIMREMGKAMMGTGEARGDKRAIMAAEAAIANPLLDEVSMKGARGLLISITGGNDLTLYEVDEAASRIRQEVDDDANIILGATFEPSLDGIVRVSVVATGIDQPRRQQGTDGGESPHRRSRAAPAGAARGPQRPSRDPVREPCRPYALRAAAAALPHTSAAERAPRACRPSRRSRRRRDPAVQPKPAAFAAPAAAARTGASKRLRRAGPLHPAGARAAAASAAHAAGRGLADAGAEPDARAAGRNGLPNRTPAETKRRTLLERLASFGMSRHDEPAAEKPRSRIVRPRAQRARPRPGGEHAAHRRQARPTRNMPSARRRSRPAQVPARPRMDAHDAGAAAARRRSVGDPGLSSPPVELTVAQPWHMADPARRALPRAR